MKSNEAEQSFDIGVSEALAEAEGWPSWTVGHAKWCKSLAQFVMSPSNCSCGEKQ